MKHLNVFVLMIMLLSISNSCKTSKRNDLKTSLRSGFSTCPSDGVCSFEVIKNQSLEIKKDDTGALYPYLIEGDTHVLKFEYKRNEIPNTQDGNYSELIFIEIPKDFESIELSNNDLAKHKVLFARLCFCRGQTGYYKVFKGQLKVSKNTAKSFNFKLDFKIDEVPQIITLIEESFKL